MSGTMLHLKSGNAHIVKMEFKEVTMLVEAIQAGSDYNEGK